MSNYYSYAERGCERPSYEYRNWNPYYPGGYESSWFVDNRALHETEAQSRYCSRLESEYTPPCYQPPCQGLVRLKLTICCEEGKRKLEKDLNGMHGVHEVQIEGWTDAMVTVIGTAPSQKILRKARKHMKSAEFWSSSHTYSTNNYYGHGHHSSQTHC